MAEFEQPLAQIEEGGEPQRSEAPDASGPPEATGLLLRGVMRRRRHERRLAKLAATPKHDLIEHMGLAALVHEVPYRLPDWDREVVRAHSSTIERAMRRGTIVPVPYGIVFRDRKHVIDFLETQHIALDEALTFLDGAFEMRLHIQPSGRRPDISEREHSDQAASAYTALRRRSRAAFTLPPAHNSILSAAFLVSRADWVSFVEYADELDADNAEFQFDLTGPWPPYDFVKVTFLPGEQTGD
jgi:Gas vesicle synthesis protein GvpL/GvpF